MGHEIPAGASYCVQGHPIALEGMQFAGAAPQGGGPYAPPPVAPGGGGQPAGPYGAPPANPPFASSLPETTNRPAQGGPGFGMGPSAAYQQPPRYAPPQPAGYTPPPAFAPAAPVQAPSAQAYGAPAPAPAAQQTGGASPSAALPAKMLRGFLVSYQTTPGGDFWALHTGRATVGRSNSGESLDIPLADATISSRHAVINVDAAMIQVEDTGSTNGTFVNDEHVGFNGRRELKDGDRVRFGGFTTIVKIVVRPLS